MEKVSGDVLPAPYLRPPCLQPRRIRVNNPHQEVIVWPNGLPPAGITARRTSPILSFRPRIAKRVGAELRQMKADVIIVPSGEVTLVDGGQAIDPQPTAPCEIEGSGIKGGTRLTAKAGDVIHIPTGIPHQFFLASGTQITCMLVKVDPPNQNHGKPPLRTRVKHVSHLSHVSNSINSTTVGTLNGSLSHRSPG
jgi:hypothetical protein